MMSKSRPCSSLESARLRPHLEDPDRRCVVDEHLGVVQPGEGFDKPGVILFAEKPARNRCASTRASEVSMRMKSCSFDISRLNIPTVLPASMPQCRAMFSTKLVLPIDGRAATITRSDLKARRHLVEVDEAARRTGDEPTMLLELLDQLVAGVDQLRDGDEARPSRCRQSGRSTARPHPAGRRRPPRRRRRGRGHRWPTGSGGGADFSLTIFA